MSQSFEQLLDAYTMAVCDHQAYVGPSPFGPTYDQKIAKDKEALCVELRAKLIAMFPAPAPAPVGEPFDLERARKGDAIEHVTYGAVHFVGHSIDGDLVIDKAGGAVWFGVDPSELRMAPPKMRTVYANVHRARAGLGSYVFYAYDNKALAKQNAGAHAIHIAYPVQIPE